MGNKKSVLASSRRDIEPSILPSQKFADVIYVALVAHIRLGILLKMFWAGCRTPPFYVSVTVIPFLLDHPQECGNVICSHAMIYWCVINAINDKSLQPMSNQWLKILSPIDYSSITHWFHWCYWFHWWDLPGMCYIRLHQIDAMSLILQKACILPSLK